MRKILVATAVPPALFVGLSALVQGFILWRTDYKTNAKTDAWLMKDFHNWAQEILDNRPKTA